MKLRESKKEHENWELYWDYMQPYIYSGTTSLMDRQVTFPPFLDKYHYIMKHQKFTNNKAPQTEPREHIPTLQDVIRAKIYLRDHDIHLDMDYTSNTPPRAEFAL